MGAYVNPIYPYKSPADLMATHPQRKPLIVIGAGPVGLAAAIDARLQGLDVLVLDLPPGTGDIQLTIVQTVSLDGAVIVTTPQEVALIDARKAVGMFQKVNVPILGIIENMSYFLCPSDGVVYHIFGKGGGEHEAKRLGVPLLGQIPIEMHMRECGDEGHPIALEDVEKSASSKAFRDIAAKLK